MFINFIRITLVSKKLDERCTIDVDLHFKNQTGEKHFDQLVIVEAKMANGKKDSSIVHAMKHFGVREKSISKYCLGVSMLVPGIKRNNFKPTLLYIHKLLSDERPVYQL
jgi:hypothetical protein